MTTLRLQTLFRDVQWAISVDWALGRQLKCGIESFTELGKKYLKIIIMNSK